MDFCIRRSSCRWDLFTERQISKLDKFISQQHLIGKIFKGKAENSKSSPYTLSEFKVKNL